MKSLVECTVGTILHETAKKYPERTAVIQNQTILTYAELDLQTDYISAHLLDLGIQQGDHIGLWGEISSDLIVLFYAIQRIGAVAVMINTLLEKEDATASMKLAELKLLFTGESYNPERDFYSEAEELQEKIPTLEKVISIRKEKTFWDGRCEDSCSALKEREDSIKPSDTAVIIFTSGSTGSPKAVMTSHYARVNSGIQQASDLGATSDDVFCVTIPMFHCFCISANILAALSCGGCLCIPNDRHTRSILSAIQEYHCTILHSVPTLYRALMSRQDFDQWNLSSLRVGIIGGSGYPPEDFSKIEDQFGITLLSSLGQTEATAGLTVSSLKDSRETRCHTVGHFMDHVEGKIADPETGEALPRGEIGEICVRGYLVMQGYYKQPELTKKAIDQDGWLHTGDLAAMDEDGNLTMKGRIKDLIIRGGENISPIEIQDKICTLPEISYCKIVPVPDPHYGEEACACIIRKENSEITADQIRSFLSGRLAPYKIPRYILFFDAMPLTAMGKVDPKAVQKVAADRLGLFTV